MIYLRRCLCLWSIFLVVAAGCGEEVETTAVSGRVTVAGEPLPGGMISFFPAAGRTRTGVIDAQGSYRTNLPAGEYKVTIQASTNPPKGWQEGDPLPPPPVQPPLKYSHHKRTPLSASVAAGPTITKDFELE